MLSFPYGHETIHPSLYLPVITQTTGNNDNYLSDNKPVIITDGFHHFLFFSFPNLPKWILHAYKHPHRGHMLR